MSGARLPRSMIVIGCALAALLAPAVAVAAAPSGGWGPDHVLDDRYDPVNSAQPAPVVAVNRSGAAAASFADPGVPYGQPAVAVKDSGGDWSAPFRPLLSGQRGVGYAGIDDAGRAVFVWTAGENGTPYPASYSIRRAGGSWSSPRTLVPATYRHEYALDSFTLSPSGYGVVAYHTALAAYVRVLTPASRWRAPVRVSGPYPDNTAVMDVRAVVNRNGVVTVAWQRRVPPGSPQGTCWKVQRSGVDAGGHVLRVITMAQRQCVREEAVGQLGVSGATRGTGAVIWYDTDQPGERMNTVVVAWRDSRGAWQRQVMPTTGRQQLTSVSMSGDRLAVWQAQGRTGWLMISHVEYRDGRWQSIHTVAGFSGPEEYPRVVALTSALTSGVEAVGWTVLLDGSWSGRHVTVVRTRVGGAVTSDRLGPQSLVWSLAAAGGHAGLGWAAPVGELGTQYVRLH